MFQSRIWTYVQQNGTVKTSSLPEINQLLGCESIRVTLPTTLIGHQTGGVEAISRSVLFFIGLDAGSGGDLGRRCYSILGPSFPSRSLEEATGHFSTHCFCPCSAALRGPKGATAKRFAV